VDVDPDLLGREAPEHGLEASLLGRRIRPIFTVIKVVVFLVISIKVEFVVIVVVGEGGRGMSAAGCSCHGSQWGGGAGCLLLTDEEMPQTP
jgi:hypothetical protein